MHIQALTLLTVIWIGLVQAIKFPNCHPPGPHKCAALIDSENFSFAWPSTSASFPCNSGCSFETSGVGIVDGDCESIKKAGDLEPQSPGFYGVFQTVYGTSLYMWAKWIASTGFSGVQVVYDRDGPHRVYLDQSQCVETTYGFNPAGKVLQCNFGC